MPAMAAVGTGKGEAAAKQPSEADKLPIQVVHGFDMTTREQ
jgi:hypothetical protein